MAKNKIVNIAEDFLDAAGFLMDQENDLVKRITRAMDEKEGNMAEYYIQGHEGTFFAETQDTDNSQLGLAELFADVALRNGLGADVAKFIPVRQTDDKTVETLQQMGRTSFAKLVELAQRG